MKAVDFNQPYEQKTFVDFQGGISRLSRFIPNWSNSTSLEMMPAAITLSYLPKSGLIQLMPLELLQKIFAEELI